MAKAKVAPAVSESFAPAVEIRALDSLAAYARNARTHDDAQVAQLMGSILEWGFTNPVLADENGIVAGHGRCAAARRLYEQGKTIRLPNGRELPPGTVPVLDVSGWSEAKRRAYILADNRIALNAGWDYDMLAVELDELRDMEFDLGSIGFSAQELNDLIGTPNIPPADGDGDGDAEGGEEAARLADRFMIPPFTVLNAREGWWQDRKRAWIALGIKSEEGRGENALGFSEVCNSGGYNAKKANDFGDASARQARKLAPGGGGGGCWLGVDGEAGATGQSGTSIFDPVLCELSYRWFSPPGGTILDPFAGGSVRGIVACKTGRQYVGHELRPEQVAANRAQASEICGGDAMHPVWIEGDSRNIDKTCSDVAADFVYTCPPYADLEVYSDNPADLSTLDYPQFRDAYFEIIAKACAKLKNNRFAAIVVGEVRDKKGNYYDFVGDTVQAFRGAGLHYYNEAILVTAVGSLPIRAGKQFSASRKLGKTHQNILVFVKGDAKKAVEACGEVDVGDDLFFGMELNNGTESTAHGGGLVSVKVSAKMARLPFAGCSPEYIKHQCKASCCQSSTSKTGTVITIHPREVAAINARGGVVVDGLLQPKLGEKKCPFKTNEHLCGIHFTPDKPFGCIASPFTLNQSGTLIVRNRYKLLKCYEEGDRLPAYKAFRASLDLIFGKVEAERICDHFERGGGDILAMMPAESYETLITNDKIKHAD